VTTRDVLYQWTERSLLENRNIRTVNQTDKGSWSYLRIICFLVFVVKTVRRIHR